MMTINLRSTVPTEILSGVKNTMAYCLFCMDETEDGSTFCPNCGRMLDYVVPAYHLQPETVLRGRYIVGAALGEGGFGITYIGYDKLFERKVAIKEYYPSGYANRSGQYTSDVSVSTQVDRKDYYDKGRQRFMREAKTLAKFCREPGIVEVLDFFEENNTAYIVMEFLDGVTLKRFIGETGKLSSDETFELMMPIMKSLKKVHSLGLIHRDISPDNIMIVDGAVKLLDFGAARDVSLWGEKSLSVMLKPGYAPAEQYSSRGEQGPWTDIYALCATMYKCITGVTPVDAASRLYMDDLKSPLELGISIRPEQERVIMTGMNIVKENRYQSIDELLADLQNKEEPDNMQFTGAAQNSYVAPIHTGYRSTTGSVPDAGYDNKNATGVVLDNAYTRGTENNDNKTVLMEDQAGNDGNKTVLLDNYSDGDSTVMMNEDPNIPQLPDGSYPFAAGMQGTPSNGRYDYPDPVRDHSGGIGQGYSREQNNSAGPAENRFNDFKKHNTFARILAILMIILGVILLGIILFHGEEPKDGNADTADIVFSSDDISKETESISNEPLKFEQTGGNDGSAGTR